jgi:hypothetical protein
VILCRLVLSRRGKWPWKRARNGARTMKRIDAAKAHLSIIELWRLRNWRGKPGQSCPAPYRKDDNPSGSVLAGGRLFHDFASGETLDAPGLLACVEQLSMSDACKLFIELANGNGSKRQPQAQRPIQRQREREQIAIDLPPLDSPTRAELQHLAALRNVSIEACEAAAERKHLFSATWRGAHCWLVTDWARRCAQFRRLDGEEFRRADGSSVKALTVRGSCASWPIGAVDVGDMPRVILCEGGGDFLAAYHFGVIENTLSEVAPVAMLGAAQRIAPEALARFAGKRVRIFPHLDTAGAAAALRWESQLRTVKIDAHCFDLSGLVRQDSAPVKDLNDVTQINADVFDANRELYALTQF